MLTHMNLRTIYSDHAKESNQLKTTEVSDVEKRKTTFKQSTSSLPTQQGTRGTDVIT